MARPVVSTLTEDFYLSLGFHTARDEEFDWPLLRFCAGWIETLIDPVYELFRDREDGKPGFAILLDPDEAPVETLPYLAQYVGARIQPGWTEAQIRAEIKSPTTWRRGQTETMRTAIKATLTDTQRVVIRERTPEPWDIYCRTLKSETPDEGRTGAVALENKVAGLILSYEAFDGLTYADLDAGFETYAAVDEAFATYGDLLDSSLPE